MCFSNTNCDFPFVSFPQKKSKKKISEKKSLIDFNVVQSVPYHAFFFFYWAVNFFVTVYKTYKLQTSLYLRKKKKEKQMIIAWTAVSVSRFHYTTQLSVHGRGFFRFRFFISVFETKVQQVYLNQLVIMRFLSSLIPFFFLVVCERECGLYDRKKWWK